MIKKLLALMLAVMVILSFAACNNNKTTDTTVSTTENTSNNSSTSATAQNLSDEASNSAPSTESTDSNSAPASTSADANSTSSDAPSGLSRGVISSNTYTNNSTGIRFTLPSNWAFYSDADLAELIGATAESMGVSDFEETLESNQNVYDMMAQSTLTGESVMVIYENLSKTDTSVDENEYLENVISTLSTMGYSADTPVTTKFCGKDYTTVKLSVDVQGVTLAQQYFTIIKDGYAVSVILTSNGNTTLEQLQSMFG